jgi:hypothetical protein
LGACKIEYLVEQLDPSDLLLRPTIQILEMLKYSREAATDAITTIDLEVVGPPLMLLSEVDDLLL